MQQTQITQKVNNRKHKAIVHKKVKKHIYGSVLSEVTTSSLSVSTKQMLNNIVKML